MYWFNLNSEVILIKEYLVNNRHKPLKTIVSAAVLAVIAANAAYAGGFSLYTESSPAAIGNYAAGTAAEAADASIGWYNPAGLILIPEQQLVVGGVGVFPTATLNGTSTFSTTTLPDYTQTFSGISGGENAFVPSAHYVLPLGTNAAFGLSLVAPFGLSTDWGVNSPVRYEATFSELITSNVSPELAAKLNDNFSFGAGLDLQYARVKFNRMIGLPTIYQAIDPTLVDSLSYNKGSSYGVGFHLGVMAMFNDKHTRLGLNYQSKMRHTFNGTSTLTGRLATPGMNIGIPPLVEAASPYNMYRTNNLFSNPIELPDVLTLSAFHDLNERFSLLGSVVYTGWSSFKSIQLNNVAVGVPNPATGVVTQLPLSVSSPENYSDTWRVAVGANYHVNQAWMIRVGGGYDQTPTNDIDRDVRLPDTNRWALSVGTHYQMRSNLGFDLGYTHLFSAETPTVNNTEVLAPPPLETTYNVNANGGSVSADLVGAQLVWTIDAPAVAATK